MRPGEITTPQFDWQMGLLARHANVLPLPEALHRVQDGTLPPRAACVTFDDGYQDNYLNALPVLKQWGIPATFFIATGFVGTGIMFNDSIIEAIRRCPKCTLDLGDANLGAHHLDNWKARHTAASSLIQQVKHAPPKTRAQQVDMIVRYSGVSLHTESRLMMDATQIRELQAAGMTIGAHTRTHPILSQLQADMAHEEIKGSRADLEGILQTPIEVFAYPNGKPNHDYARRDCELVQAAGFKYAVSTSPGAASSRMDPFQVPRFTPWDRTDARFLMRLAVNARRAGTLAS